MIQIPIDVMVLMYFICVGGYAAIIAAAAGDDFNANEKAVVFLAGSAYIAIIFYVVYRMQYQ